MTLTMTQVKNADSPLLAEIQPLYETAFPKAERVPFATLTRASFPRYDSELFAFMDGTTFVGFATTISQDALSLLGYFAMSAELRGQGYGSKALTLLKANRPAGTLALEIETLDPAAANAAQRVAREHFYLKNGFRDSEIRYQTWGVPYSVLIVGPTVSEAAYHDFYDPLVKKRD